MSTVLSKKVLQAPSAPRAKSQGSQEVRVGKGGGARVKRRAVLQSSTASASNSSKNLTPATFAGAGGSVYAGAFLTHLGEEALAVLAAQGVDGAWEALYPKVWPWALEQATLYGKALGWSADDAEDWAQEALLRAWKFRARYRPNTSYRVWLRRIVLNEVGQTRRRSRRRMDALGRAGFDGAPQCGTGEGFWHGAAPMAQDTKVERREQSAELREVLLSLSTEDQELLVLWAEGRLAEYRDPETGGVCNPTTVRTKVHKAKRRMKERARQMGLGE